MLQPGLWRVIVSGGWRVLLSCGVQPILAKRIVPLFPKVRIKYLLRLHDVDGLYLFLSCRIPVSFPEDLWFWAPTYV